MEARTVIDLTGRPTDDARRAPLIDIKEVAARLGVEVRYVRRLVQERRLTFHKVGHLLRFDPADVDRFIERSRVPGRQ